MPKNLMSEIETILYSGQLGFGKYGAEFETKLKSFIGCEYLLTVNSYNIAMLVVLSTLGLQPGDEIIASPVSCLASNQPFSIKGLKVVWADINPQTGGMCPEDVKFKINNKTKAIFHNHFCGFLSDIEAINAIGKTYGIPVVDDAIEAFGSEFKNKKIGNLGTDLTVFSFQTVRLPNTIDGGAIAFKDKTLYEKAKLIRDYGIDRSKFRTQNSEINPNCDIELEGYGGLMSELNSFIGCKQMDQLPNLLEKQRINAVIWDKKISQHSEAKSLRVLDNVKPNYWVYGLLSDTKDTFIHSFKDKGFFSTGVHINNNIYKVFNDKRELKGVNEFMKRFVAIPSGWWVNSNKI